MGYYYGYAPNDYLCHYGVQGMKWGQHLFGKIQAASANRKATKEAVKSEKKRLKTSYAKDKGPKRHVVLNAANSAARSYYRAQRTNSFKTYRRQTGIQDKKEARLTQDQITAGRYRVARARNIKSKVFATSVGLMGAAAVASGGAVLAGALVGGVVGVAANGISGGWYYSGQQRAYGSTKAKYQAKENVKNQQKADQDNNN